MVILQLQNLLCCHNLQQGKLDINIYIAINMRASQKQIINHLLFIFFIFFLFPPILHYVLLFIFLFKIQLKALSSNEILKLVNNGLVKSQILHKYFYCFGFRALKCFYQFTTSFKTQLKHLNFINFANYLIVLLNMGFILVEFFHFFDFLIFKCQIDLITQIFMSDQFNYYQLMGDRYQLFGQVYFRHHYSFEIALTKCQQTNPILYILATLQIKKNFT
ncbi:transmembrane protein, putative (macronuclear) [Tetrahymena thermophila SB210]|uniref:Transmembrane protein, putative n=1 Tax=Tetrahymena thermophila (strain SB210) TaxID=312017 RepID=W7XIN9_TETTS|nr:transmembrane protein, putative [Tetrahymena thermophila SB210]EWS73479.1 transmembrane protein, putative [Tetrahymena thermophila SB210]|eukprot:XP_012653961.1 transmembrane protein, putative [Tetrahymena thermophila SB210]